MYCRWCSFYEDYKVYDHCRCKGMYIAAVPEPPAPVPFEVVRADWEKHRDQFQKNLAEMVDKE
jgi:hypothetical protein